MNKNLNTWTALALIAVAVAYRVMPHPQNVTPVAAAAIFAGAVLPGPLAFTVPLLAMIAGDLVIGPHDLFWLTWSAFALTAFFGIWVRRRLSVPRIAAASVAGSTFYFFVTNLGVFLFENMYPKTWAGLGECFTMALPFYRNALIGDLLFSAVLFGIYALAVSANKPRTSSASPRT